MLPTEPLTSTILTGINQNTIILAPQQKMEQTTLNKIHSFRISEGVLLIYTTTIKPQRHVLDFLFPGDMLMPELFPPLLRIGVRAVTPTTLAPFDAPSKPEPTPSAFSLVQSSHRIIHRMAMNHLSTEDKVASAILFLTLRCSEIKNNMALLPMPMSREDMADYISVNPDTLSRVTSKFESLRMIERLDRHKIIILDVRRLASISTLAPHFLDLNAFENTILKPN